MTVGFGNDAAAYHHARREACDLSQERLRVEHSLLVWGGSDWIVPLDDENSALQNEPIPFAAVGEAVPCSEEMKMVCPGQPGGVVHLQTGPSRIVDASIADVKRDEYTQVSWRGGGSVSLNGTIQSALLQDPGPVGGVPEQAPGVI